MSESLTTALWFVGLTPNQHPRLQPIGFARTPTPRSLGFLGIRDRTAEALREVRLAQELDPLALPITSSLERLLTYAGETGEAFEHLDAAICLEPAYPWTWFGLALAHTQRNEPAEAIRTAERALELARASYASVPRSRPFVPASETTQLPGSSWAR
jgi:tetratricopeptide (TPR) repeat protein